VEPPGHASTARAERVEAAKEPPSAPAARLADELTMATLARLPRDARGVVLARSRGAPTISNRAAARILAREAAAKPRNPERGTFRKTVLEVLRPFAETVLSKGQKPGEPDVYGAAEGSELFHSIVSAATVESGRKDTALAVLEGRSGKGTVWTSCIAFLVAVLGRGAAASGGKIPKMGGTDAEAKAAKIPGAWHPGSEVESKSPLPGDMYVFHYPDDHPKRPGWFSHTGLVWAIEKQSDGTQVWWTIDGGQGQAGEYVATRDPSDPKKITYTETKRGKESILKRRRVYDPTTKRMKGGENADLDDRVLRGWVDIDQLVTLPPGYGYEYGDDPLNAGGFGVDDAMIRVKPGPVRTTVIQPRE
jgi:hypothetical protein